MSANKRLELLAFKSDSFDTDSFVRATLDYTENSILYVYNFSRLFLVHKPEDVTPPSAANYLPVPKHRLLSPIVGLLNLLWVVVFSAYLCVRYRPRVCWTDNTWSALVFAIARKIGWCECYVYNVGDWVDSTRQNIISYVLNNIIWRSFDYIATAFSDLVLSLTDEIVQARDRFWGKKVAKRVCSSFPPPLTLREHASNKMALNICFIGQVRSDSGLDLLLPLLPGLHQKYGIKLKMAGPRISYREEIERQIETLGLKPCVELYGWVETRDMEKVMGDCFCGINLITSKTSYSSYTIPGKLFHYLQNMLPVIITEGNGPFTDFVRKDKLGLVIEPDPNQIAGAIENLFKQQESFRENIRKCAGKKPSKEIKDYIDIASGKYDS